MRGSHPARHGRRRHVVKEAKALQAGFARRGGISPHELPKAREYVALLEKVPLYMCIYISYIYISYICVYTHTYIMAIMYVYVYIHI
jgi:hypothetical protein